MLKQWRLDLLRRRLVKLAKAKDDVRLSPKRRQAMAKAHAAVARELRANLH
jgi:hypothetical protein